MTRKLVYILLTVVLLMGVSCERRPMFDGYGGNLYIHIELDVDVDADMDEATKSAKIMPPKLFAVLLYNPETHELLKTDYVSSKGGYVQVDPGYYDIVVYNFDTDYVKVRGEQSLLRLEAFTSEVTSDISSKFRRVSEYITRNKVPEGQTRGYSEQPLVYQPDHLLADMVENFHVPYNIEENKVIHIHVHPTTISEKYTIRISPLLNGEYLSTADVFLTGMGSAKHVTGRHITGGPAAIWFPIQPSEDYSYLYTTFYSFGPYPDSEGYFVLLHLLDVNKGEYNFEWDVTDQIKSGSHDIVIDDQIVITPTPGGGSTPTVDDWDENYTNILLQ